MINCNLKRQRNIIIYLLLFNIGKSKNESAPKNTNNSICVVQIIQPNALPAVSEI